MLDGAAVGPTAGRGRRGLRVLPARPLLASSAAGGLRRSPAVRVGRWRRERRAGGPHVRAEAEARSTCGNPGTAAGGAARAV